MEVKPFAKISVSDICEACDMNRKSFYYHFKDKYDLVNWIYDTECLAALSKKGGDAGWDVVEELCAYFYENRGFYRKTLAVEGQNFFSEYLRDIAGAMIARDLEAFSAEGDSFDFFVNFYTDAFLCAVKRWLLDRDCMPAGDFSRLLKRCLPHKTIRAEEPEKASADKTE